jgi:aryl-alcohol dehydrogenase-like predicted oxidoreductase
VPFEEQIGTLAEMRSDGLIRHIGLSNVSAEQFRTARRITEIAAVTAHYNVSVRLGAALRKAADDAGVVFSPWHPAAVPGGDDSARIRAALDPIAARTGATVQQVALAWQLHRSPGMLPIPGTTSIAHLKENLAAAKIRLAAEDVDTITGLMPEDDQPAGQG